MTDSPLLIPLGQAGRKLSMTRKTLRKHIDAKLIRTVKIGTRSFIPSAEMDRLTGASVQAGENGELSLAPSNENHGESQNGVEKLPNRKRSSVSNGKDWIWALLAELEEIEACQMKELEEDAIAGNPEAIAAKAALDAIAPGIPAGLERQREIGRHNETWAAWREWRKVLSPRRTLGQD
jgi:hypothetical protein